MFLVLIEKKLLLVNSKHLENLNFRLRLVFTFKVCNSQAIMKYGPENKISFGKL